MDSWGSNVRFGINEIQHFRPCRSTLPEQMSTLGSNMYGLLKKSVHFLEILGVDYESQFEGYQDR